MLLFQTNLARGRANSTSEFRKVVGKQKSVQSLFPFILKSGKEFISYELKFSHKLLSCHFKTPANFRRYHTTPENLKTQLYSYG